LKEELTELAQNPSERAARCKALFEKYRREALDLFAKGDTRLAARKLWAATLALVKLYAAAKGIFVAHWSRATVLPKAQVLHEHFYEENLYGELFRERWSEALELLERVKGILYEKL
jgi:hypothetical protein